MKLTRWAGAAGLAVILATAIPNASAQEKYLGEIIMTGANFCPRGTFRADGQLLPIAQHTALFSLYGTMYGGDGRSTFALPDLRGRMAVHAGQSPGQADRRLGSVETVEVPPVMGKQAEQAATFGSSKVTSLAITYCIVAEGIYPSRS